MFSKAGSSDAGLTGWLTKVDAACRSFGGGGRGAWIGASDWRNSRRWDSLTITVLTLGISTAGARPQVSAAWATAMVSVPFVFVMMLIGGPASGDKWSKGASDAECDGDREHDREQDRENGGGGQGGGGGRGRSRSPGPTRDGEKGCVLCPYSLLPPFSHSPPSLYRT
ncbi:hypothetical protein B0H12DRAFT_828166 [Mycena haematopus]|nr:hypothetical protein B0H12DRAFT_828166 [Mycena haematopus]